LRAWDNSFEEEHRPRRPFINPAPRPHRNGAPIDFMFWLPPDGRDNGVWAVTWALIADLESDDAVPVLDVLAEAGIGGYTASRADLGDPTGTPVGHRLWVDSMQYRRAQQVLTRSCTTAIPAQMILDVSD
jgi:hypothetical protein